MRKLYRLWGAGISVILEENDPTTQFFVDRIIQCNGIPQMERWTA
jgi:hypothetical protein